MKIWVSMSTCSVHRTQNIWLFLFPQCTLTRANDRGLWRSTRGFFSTYLPWCHMVLLPGDLFQSNSLKLEYYIWNLAHVQKLLKDQLKKKFTGIAAFSLLKKSTLDFSWLYRVSNILVGCPSILPLRTACWINCLCIFSQVRSPHAAISTLC